MKITMPGPVFSFSRAISDSIDTFHSCEDVQEAWVCNGDTQQDTHAHLNGRVPKKAPHVNGIKINKIAMEGTTSIKEELTPDQDSSLNRNVTFSEEEGQGHVHPEEGVEEGEEEEEEGEQEDDVLAESINIPVVEARLSLDISQALTRQKISSVQRGRTLSYADTDDSEEAPTRRARFFSHKDSLELGGPPQHPPPPPTTTGGGGSSQSPCLTPKMEKSSKIARNPSYHSAVRVSPVVEIPPPSSFALGSQNYTSSSEEGSPEHDYSFASAETIHKFPAKSGPPSSSSSVLAKLEKNQPLDVPVAANMPRSASFSGGGILSPSSPAIDSFRQVYGRRGSISQPSTPVTKRALLPKPLPKEVTHNNNIKITRGSAITRSFRRLFSTPLKSSSSPAASSTEDYWLDTPEPESPTPSESRSTSRLRKLSTTLTRKLSTRTKMSNSYTFPTNGHGQGINGEPMPESSTLVDYEELMKLFSCSGCQAIMAPPLYQCRKGHLVCNTCRFSLKQVCPVCKQRFAETTNLMMEQVCHLVKFPCKWSNRGCPEFHLPKARTDHEHFCIFRPLHCHHASRGCPKILLLRDMEEHLMECEYRDFKEK
ncbi:LOW QUALITY PROTEIN: uncharacterized protein [Macrobrachium rosenbergii]|uniref:LOW QUALITY PROTEIN: uncharacterized protein n=1 Tax=Macrobrachium rosenbergii TaxID=79674 RepID=UPI0034D3CF47